MQAMVSDEHATATDSALSNDRERSQVRLPSWKVGRNRATERLLRANDKERADRADQQTREAETRVKEVEEQLQAEIVEHRRVVSLLAEQLAARRSWRLWRRR